MKIRLLAILASFVVACLGSNAMAQRASRADCVLRIDTSNTNWVIRGHDAFGKTDPASTFEVIFRNDGGRACIFQTQFALDGESFGLRNGGEPTLAYSLIDASRRLNVTPVSGRTFRRGERGQMVVQPGRQELVRFLLNVPDPRISSDGLYFQNVIIEAEAPNGDILGGRQLVLGLDVLPSALMSLSGAFRRNNGQATINFGALQDGPVKLPLELQVRSTRGYRVTFDSQNQGRLRLGSTEWTINYDLIVDGKTLQLSSSETYSASRPKSAFDRLPLGFQINGTKNKRAGVYSDTLTIAVAAY